MSESFRCPKCGIQLLADAPAGLCPKCLVQAGLESQPVPHAGSAPTGSSAASSGFEPPPVEELAAKFPQLEVLELLGKGGMGAVYKARQRGLERMAAIKILPPEIGRDAAFAERFTREARALARLTHNHIVSVYDFGQTDGLFYIVMEFVDGANLRQTIRTGTMTPAEALAIVPQICEALQFAHDEGIVHRDIKPENVLIDKRGRVKIADFGLAKLLGADSGDHLLTATHQVMGTARYMAPEQMQGSREVDHRADIYSLGVVFYELLTGELPMGKFAPPSKKVQVDVRLDEIVLRALEQEPEQRYQHASEVKTDVETISTGNARVRMTAVEEQRDDTWHDLVNLLVRLFVAFVFIWIGAGAWLGGKDALESLGLAVHDFWIVFGQLVGVVLALVGVVLIVRGWPRQRRRRTREGRASSAGHLVVQAPADCLFVVAGVAFVTACGVAVWLLAAPASSIISSLARGNLMGMSVGLAIYSVFVSAAGLMLRRLRGRLFVLLITVIVGLFLPAVCALNVVMEFRNIPVWPVVLPLWLGMPAALWVAAILFRDDVRRAFDAAAKQRAEKTGAPSVQ